MSDIAITVVEQTISLTETGSETVEVSVVETPVTLTVQPGLTDHGQLQGLGDDDHPQYLLRTDYVPGGDADTLEGHPASYFEVAGVAATLDAAHVAQADPHTQYLKESDYTPFSGDADTLDGHDSTYFEVAGVAATLDAAHVAAANPHAQYLLESALPTTLFGGDFSDVATPVVGDDGKALVWDNANQRAIWSTVSSGSTPGGSSTYVQYNNAGVLAGESGFTYAGSGVATLTGRLVVPVIRSASDSTTAVKIQNAAGSSDVVVVDTTNLKFIIGNSTPTVGKVEITETSVARPAISIQHGTNSNVIAISKSTGTGSIMNVTMSSAQSDGILFTNTDSATYLANRTMLGVSAILSTGTDLLGGSIAGKFQSTNTRTTKGTNSDLAIGVEAIASSSITTAGVFGYALRATASTKNISPIYAKTASGAGDTDAAAIDAVNSGGTRTFGITPTGRIMTNQAVTNTNTPSGATAKALAIYDTAGTLLGYIPVYGSAW